VTWSEWKAKKLKATKPEMFKQGDLFVTCPECGHRIVLWSPAKPQETQTK
jgi:DNA-directed RNA polymerase subunit RPC12/RpoP